MAITDLIIGDREVWLGGQKIGYTKGGSEVTIEREFQDITADEFGKSPIDKALVGVKFAIKFMLAEISEYNLQKVLPESTYNVGTVDDKTGIGRRSGYLLGQDAQELRLHKKDRAATDYTDDIFMFRAVSDENIVIPFKIDEQTVIPVTMHALVDTSRADGLTLGRIGPDLIS